MNDTFIFDADDDQYERDGIARRTAGTSAVNEPARIQQLEAVIAEYRLLLRVFTFGNTHYGGEPRRYHCNHCDAPIARHIGDIQHVEDCPVERGRKLLAGE